MKSIARNHKKALIAAGLLTLAVTMTGCGAETTPTVTPTPNTAQKVTTEPTVQPTQTPEASPETSPEATDADGDAPLPLRVDGKTIDADAVIEQDVLLLPLENTAEALGYSVTSDEVEEETQVKKTVQLKKDESQITITWTVSDNTAKQITWQKDGLLIPVDTRLTTIGETVYVPAAFFETAMDVTVNQSEDGVTLTTAADTSTPANDAQQQEADTAN